MAGERREAGSDGRPNRSHRLRPWLFRPARERRAPVTGTDGITRSRLETGHGRGLATLFGAVRVTRCAWRQPGAGNFCPADAAVSLPHSKGAAS
jgi:hypothetical protein